MRTAPGSIWTICKSASDSSPALTPLKKPRSKRSPRSSTRNRSISTERAAQASIFKGLAASGWHTAAIAMRLLVDGGLPFAHGIVGLGGEIAWPGPTRPDDILHVESEIVEITPSRSKPHQGIVTVRVTMFNQNGEAVYRLTAKLLVLRRQK
jgi:acyl dehydratase